VVTNALSDGSETVEIAHEALIRNWPTLIDWLSRDREFQFWLKSLRLRLDERRSFPTDDGTLLRGGPLIQAEKWLSKRADDLSSEEKFFIEDSVTLREAEKIALRRRLPINVLGKSKMRRTALPLDVDWRCRSLLR
jgi:hypothetical protein